MAVVDMRHLGHDAKPLALTKGGRLFPKLWQRVKKSEKANRNKVSGGEEGIRTLDTVSGILP